jgi:hypothetical protein
LEDNFGSHPAIRVLVSKETMTWSVPFLVEDLVWLTLVIYAIDPIKRLANPCRFN